VIGDYLLDHGKVRFLQVGANDGVMLDPLFPLLEKHRLEGILMEPMKDHFSRLRQNYAAFEQRRFTFVNAAIADRDGTIPLYRIRSLPGNPGWASGIASFNRNNLLKHRDYFASSYESGSPGAVSPPPDLDSVIDIEPVQCMTFDSLFATISSDHIDLLQIDVEGYDAEVLRLFDVPARRPAIIRYEHMHLSEHVQEACLELLIPLGYKIDVGPMDTLAYNRAY
jgi:FkbM family methyltransferase